MSEENPDIPESYYDCSNILKSEWDEYDALDRLVKKEIEKMFEILRESGFTRHQAIEKILHDHKDQRDFHRRLITQNIPSPKDEEVMAEDMAEDMEKITSEDK